MNIEFVKELAFRVTKYSDRSVSSLETAFLVQPSGRRRTPVLMSNPRLLHIHQYTKSDEVGREHCRDLPTLRLRRTT